MNKPAPRGGPNSLPTKWILTHCQRCDGLGYDEIDLDFNSTGENDTPCCECHGNGSVLVEVLAFNPNSIDLLEDA